MLDLIVVGAGIFGSILTAEARRRGMTVLQVDAEYPGSGSKAAACLMKPSWFSGMHRTQTDAALQLLDELYGVEDIQFSLLGMKALNATVHWVNPRAVLSHDYTVMQVDTVGDGWVEDDRKDRYHARAVIVAAGIWCKDLVQEPVRGLCGWAFKAQRRIDPFIKPWAPYRQIVGFNIDTEWCWVGDGTALKYGSCTMQAYVKSAKRCAEAAGLDLRADEFSDIFGQRPYMDKALFDGEPCLFQQSRVGKNTWVATGGAKNGTIAAAWAATKLGRVLA
jgi:hypothetical protein